jgi:TolB-like protein
VSDKHSEGASSAPTRSQAKFDRDLEIGHVLFLDIVGYSKLPINRQSEFLQEMNQIVRATEQFRSAETAGKLVRLPTGDGMALVFFTRPDAPVRCAVEISHALKEYPQLHLRMGINSGPVESVLDVNERSNIAGAGINMAQRVMDCGDPGHILLSQRVADDLNQYEEWQPHLHDLGEFEVKHGVRIGVVNFCSDDIGNPAVPEKLRRLTKLRAAGVRRHRMAWALVMLCVMIALAVGFWWQGRRVARVASSAADVLDVSEKSIAVLPLENLSEDKENAFFADGIQDDVLTSLAKISALKVISRTSVMQYRGAVAARNLREIAQALGVANIMEGTVRRIGNRVLINVQLVDPRSGRQIWAERYDRTIADAIGLQGELAAEIAGALKAKLAPEEKVRLATKPTTNPEAYLLYLRARERGRTGASKEDAFATDELYARAIALDPEFALAIARRSMWNGLMYNVGRRPEQKSKAPALAAQALQLSPDLPEAHLALGLCYYWIERNYPAALNEFSIAAEASALEPDVLEFTGLIYCRQGRWRDGLAAYDRAQERDPRQVHLWGPRARAMVRDWPRAVAGFERLLAIEPNNLNVTVEFAGLHLTKSGDFAAARKLLDGIPPGLHGPPGQPSAIDAEVTQVRWEMSMLARDYTSAEKILADYKAEEFPDPVVGLKTYDAGQLALARGDVDSAKALFEKVRPIYEKSVVDHQDDASFHAPLGLLYAFLGRKDDAIRESLRAVELVPESKDAQGGATYSSNLALVYARTGEIDQAIALIERLLTIPNGPSLTDLRLDWQWDPLRTNPRFQTILAGPEPETIYN